MARPALLLALVAAAAALAPSGPGRRQDRAAGRRIEPRAAARVAAPGGATKPTVAETPRRRRTALCAWQLLLNSP